MALTAGDLISAAKKRTFGKGTGQKLSVPALLEELSFQDQLIVQEISQISPDLLAYVDGEVTVTSSENQYGYSLSAGIHYRNFTHVDPTSDVYTPINLVAPQFQEHAQRHPAGMLNLAEGTGTFYPIDPTGSRWTGDADDMWYSEDAGHKINYSYVRLPTVLTALDDTLVSPDMARESLVTALELAIYLSDPKTPPQYIQVASERYNMSRVSLMFQVNKFMHPAGQRPNGSPRSDASWVSDQVGR